MRSQLCNLTVCLCVLLLAQLEKCAQDLGSTSKAVGSSMAQLLTCAAQGNEHYTGEKRAFCTEGEEVTEASGSHKVGQFSSVCSLMVADSVDLSNVTVAPCGFN